MIHKAPKSEWTESGRNLQCSKMRENYFRYGIILLASGGPDPYQGPAPGPPESCQRTAPPHFKTCLRPCSARQLLFIGLAVRRRRISAADLVCSHPPHPRPLPSPSQLTPLPDTKQRQIRATARNQIIQLTHACSHRWTYGVIRTRACSTTTTHDIPPTPSPSLFVPFLLLPLPFNSFPFPHSPPPFPFPGTPPINPAKGSGGVL